MSKYTIEFKKLFVLSFPLMLSYFTYFGKSVVDTIMVGNIDKNNLAGMALASSILFMLFSFVYGVGSAIVPFLTEKLANNDKAGFRNIFYQSVYLNYIIYVILLIPIVFSHYLFDIFNLEQQTKDIAYSYLLIMGASGCISAIANPLVSILRAIEKNKYLTVAAISVFTLNIPLNYLFIYTWDMGAVGSAYASVICLVIEMFIYIYFTYKQQLDLYLEIPKPLKADLIKYCKFSIPISIGFLIEESVFGIVGMLLARFGEIYVAANEVAAIILILIYMIPAAIGHVVVQRISYNIAKGNIEQVKIIIVSACAIAMLSALNMLLIFSLFGDLIVESFSSDLEIVKIVKALIGVIIVYHIVDSIQIIGISVMRAYKKNKETMYIAIGCYWVLTIGIGHVLSYNYSIYGYWMGMLIGFSVATIIAVGYVHKLVWKEKYG